MTCKVEPEQIEKMQFIKFRDFRLNLYLPGKDQYRMKIVQRRKPQAVSEEGRELA